MALKPKFNLSFLNSIPLHLESYHVGLPTLPFNFNYGRSYLHYIQFEHYSSHEYGKSPVRIWRSEDRKVV